MTVATRTLLVAGSALLALAGLAAPAAVAAPNTTIDQGESVSVSIRGVDRVAAARINWGDGTATVARTACSTAKATRRPGDCTARARHVYAKPGQFTITSTRKGRTMVVRQVTVTPVAEVPTTPGEGWQQDMLAAVNDLREAAGVPPLSLCAPLERSAQAYSRAMADQGFFDHTGPDGSTPGTRVNDQGYDWSYVGENIAFGQQSVSSVMTAWRTSPSHYANMISPEFTNIGFGWASNPANARSPIWTQDFATGGTC